MRFSVIIPAYNAARTVGATLDSVLAQSVVPHEILVFDDGSTDNTPTILESYKPRIKVFRQSNQGAAHARNYLCAQAQGDMLAFLDADDLWHPGYLAAQKQMIERYPDAVAWFTYHEDFVGVGNFNWPDSTEFRSVNPELIEPLVFIKRYNQTPMSFQMSCCCVRKSLMSELGQEPFQVPGAEDTFFHHLLPLWGPVAHTTERFAAYRIIESSLSSNRLKISVLVVDAFKKLNEIYKAKGDPVLYDAFRTVFASRRRNCGKYLMGSKEILDARTQFMESLKIKSNPSSLLKSLVLLILTFMPSRLQTNWLPSVREIKPFQGS
jgi:glycosyltransferase involved in cell wall biosynthesis